MERFARPRARPHASWRAVAFFTGLMTLFVLGSVFTAKGLVDIVLTLLFGSFLGALTYVLRRVSLGLSRSEIRYRKHARLYVSDLPFRHGRTHTVRFELVDAPVELRPNEICVELTGVRGRGRLADVVFCERKTVSFAKADKSCSLQFDLPNEEKVSHRRVKWTATASFINAKAPTHLFFDVPRP